MASEEEYVEYEVEDIIRHKYAKSSFLFLIRWKNYDETFDTWESEENLSCPKVLARYMKEHPEICEKPNGKHDVSLF